MNRRSTSTSRSEPSDSTPNKLVGYKDDGAYIICERSNPNAWIRSDVTVEASQSAEKPSNDILQR